MIVESPITIVIASYGYGHLIAHAIDSVLGQSRPAQEIVVCDDGFGDVRGVLERCLYRDDRIRFVDREQNLGTIANFDDLLRNHVRTRRCMFLGGDNWLRADALAILSAIDAEIVSYDLCYAGQNGRETARIRGGCGDWHGWPRWSFDPDGKDIHGPSNFIHGSALYDAQVAQQFGYSGDAGNRYTNEDWHLWRKMIAAGARHKHVSEPLLFYRRHRCNTTGET